jgi:carboxypeptidase Taq
VFYGRIIFLEENYRVGIDVDTLKASYDALMKKAKAVTILQSTEAIMNWDMETKMPRKGITLRSEQLAMLSGIEHRMSTDRQIGDLLEKIVGHPDYATLDAIRRRNMYLIRKRYDEQTKLPEKLVTETAKQRAITIETWKKAKAAQDFALYKPELVRLLDLRKQAADILMEVKESPTPYDALIDIYEPNITSKTIATIFNRLKTGLIAIIDKCQTSKTQPNTSFLRRRVPIAIQRNISKILASFIGYDVESERAGGRIDETEHPFSTGYYDDVRITTHYYENKLTSSLFSVLHESGHAIYQQNLNPDWIYKPIGSDCSLGIHESQSRFVENIIGRSRDFWSYFLPTLKNATGTIFSDVDLDTFVFAINQVTPSKIRTESDEVTYCLHIIIRFEIEDALMRDKITVTDLPEVWNQKYQDYLNVEIENDSEGVMQDTHWAGGAIGYFPTYALGNIYSGQLLIPMQRELPDWKRQISAGDFHLIKNWLVENIHRHGNLYDPADLMKKITGEEINIQPYLNYLTEKYSTLYDF